MITQAALAAKLQTEGKAFSNPYAGYTNRNSNLDVIQARVEESEDVSGGDKSAIREAAECIKQNSKAVADHVGSTISDMATTIPQAITYAENYLQGDTPSETLANACRLVDKAYGLVNDVVFNEDWNSVEGAVNSILNITNQPRWEDQLRNIVDIMRESCDTSSGWPDKIAEELDTRNKVKQVLDNFVNAYSSFINHPCAQRFIHRVATPEMRNAIYTPEIAARNTEYIIEQSEDMRDNPLDYILDPSRRTAIEYDPVGGIL